MRIKHLLLCLAAMLISTSILADKYYTLKVINHTQWTTNVITVLVPESEEPQKEVSRIPRHQSTEEVFTLADEANKDQIMITSINNLLSECVAENFEMPLKPQMSSSESSATKLTLEIFENGPVGCLVKKTS